MLAILLVAQGAIYSAEDSSGDCRLFTEAIVAKTRSLGAQFRFNEPVIRINTSNNKVVSVETTEGTYEADKFVFCGGVAVNPLLRLGINIPVYPIKVSPLRFTNS